jgi:acyl-CoA synthetase (AMP-forming)/AMP-acid ligase II
VIAFSVPGPERELVVLAAERRDERDEEAATLGAAVRQAVFARVRFLPDDIVLLPPRSLPLTSSGKVMRPAAKQRYLDGRWKST